MERQEIWDSTGSGLTRWYGIDLKDICRNKNNAENHARIATKYEKLAKNDTRIETTCES
jgi:hypothetical protein